MPRVMGAICVLLTLACAASAAFAAPATAISCAVQRLSEKQQAELGRGLNDRQGDFAGQANTIIAQSVSVCAKANAWTDKQTDAAIGRSTWHLLNRVIERRSGLTPADLAIMRAYVDENVAKLDGLERYTSAQMSQLIATLRQRGAHLHDVGKDSENELPVLLLFKEMNKKQGRFATP